MVFSFFRKKDEEPAAREAPRPRVAVPAPGAKPAPGAGAKPGASPRAPGIEIEFEPHHTVSSIEVADSAAGLSQAAEEAAILYANDRADAAIDTLLHAIAADPKLQRSPQAWFMLFDLFQVQGMKTEFDKLASDFSMQFERSAPSWVDANAAARGGLPASLRTGGGRYVSLAGTLAAASQAQIKEMMKAGQKEGVYRLDFAKLEGVETAGCQLLLGVLQVFRRHKNEIMLSGTERLEELLKAALAASPGESAHYLLLLELYQILGRQEEFENLSVDYAVAFEVSPPSWETPPAKPKAAEPAPEPAAPEVPPEAFRMSGVVAGANPPQLAELVNYGAGRSVVNVDMAQVKRVDFVAAGALLNAFSGLTQNGKTVMVSGANEMIQALFAVIGINQFAIVSRNKQH